MALCEIEKSTILKSQHGFSTRLDGVSTGIFTSLNLGVDRGDDIENVQENWRRFLEACGIPQTKVVFGKQVHGNQIHVAEIGDARPIENIPNPLQFDGYVTKVKNLPLAISTADCVPVLLEDTVNQVVGALHCGWRPTVADIEKEAITKMIELGADVNNIRAAIGPAIDMCCFEVGSEVISAVDELLGPVEAAVFYQKREEKYMLNLRGVVRERLIQLGVHPENIEKVGTCTMCHPDRYFSHRYTNGQRGSQFSIIML